MLGKEKYILPRPCKPAPSIGVSWAFPNTYALGMSSLGYQLVWWLLEQDTDLAVRRVFLDCGEAGWQESELIGFTLSWELDFLNILRLLDRAGVSRLAADRRESEPFVFAGGPVLSANPEPYADFFDAVLLGDAEAVVPSFVECWQEIRRLPSRKERLEALAAVPGVYVPSLYEYEFDDATGPVQDIRPKASLAPNRVLRQVFTPPPDYAAHSLMIVPDTTFGDMFLVEVARSCPQECRFCLASYLTRPFRAADPAALIEKIDLGRKHTRKIGLLGPSVTEHPQFDRIAGELLKRPDVDISIASIRADTIDPVVLEMLVALGQKSVTIALESGSERLRAVMKKNLSEAQVHQAMDMIAASGLTAVKLYGIVGLPGETAADIDETIRLLSDLKRKHRHLRFTFGLSSFVPKAQTPFQWCGRDRRAADKIEHVRKRLASIGIDVRPESHNWSDIQALLSRGDRRLAPVLSAIADSDGRLGAWRRAWRAEAGRLPPADFFVFRDIPTSEFLPWSHLTDSPKQALLLKQHDSAGSAGAGPQAKVEPVGHN